MQLCILLREVTVSSRLLTMLELPPYTIVLNNTILRIGVIGNNNKYIYKIQTLCCKRSFVAGILRSSLDVLWHSLRREVFMNDNEEIASHALEFVKAAFVVLSSDETILNECLQLIFTGKNIFLQIRLKKEANNFLKPTI